MTGEHARRRRVVIVGGRFAGFHAARAFSRLAKALPLLPEVAAGILDPRRVSVPLAATLPGVQLVLGTVEGVDLDGRRVGLVDPEGRHRMVAHDRLLLAAGSVNRLLLDRAPRVLPELDRRLSATADRDLRQRGVEVRLQTTVQAPLTASLGDSRARPYRHHDLGVVVDLAAPRPPPTRSACPCRGCPPRP
jgi:NADH dehydrogenase FAD-containing subunit